MDQQLLSTCVKVDDVPLLPPLVTTDLTTELNYYKKLSVAVAQRLELLEIALKKSQEPFTDLIGASSKSESDGIVVENGGGGCVTAPLIDLNEKTEKLSEPIIIKSKEIVSEPLMNNTNLDKFLSNKNTTVNKSLLDDSISSSTVTASTDANQYLNTSNDSVTTDTIKTTPENWKPQVPKTLDIIPITLENSQQSSEDESNKPKLVRRGSYVLDAPSPVLLAHLQQQSASSDYTPTPSDSSVSKPKSRLAQPNRARRSSTNIPVQRISKSVSSSKAGSPLDLYPPARSVDCIRSMFAKESNAPKTSYRSLASNKSYSKYSPSNYSVTRKTNTNNSNNNKSSSLGNLSNVKVIRPRDGKVNNNNNNNINNNYNSNINAIISSANDSDSNSNFSSFAKQKPLITSERIASVFKEIQEAHKKQMVELLTRQQKEQVIMQSNFKKQQIVLLAHIRKSFPEISMSSLVEAVSTTKSSQDSGSSPPTNLDSSNSPPQSQINGINHYNASKVEKSPKICMLDPKELPTPCRLNFRPTHDHLTEPFQNNNNCQSPHTIQSSTSLILGCSLTPSPRTIDEIPVGIPNRKQSNVSRQLFYNENKKPAPVFDNSAYDDRHIKAVTTINAYVRGFLVRRLMRTEKIIALKNTYKEALHCMLKLHVDAPLNMAELNFHQRLQLQCDAASMSIVDLFSQSPSKRMEVIASDREAKKLRTERPSSSRSFSFATQRTLARKKMRESGQYSLAHGSIMIKSCPARTKCQTWNTSFMQRRNLSSSMSQGIKRSTSTGAVRKPWR